MSQPSRSAIWRHRTSHPSLVVPAIRMVYVWATAIRKERLPQQDQRDATQEVEGIVYEHTIYPVVAIVSYIKTTYDRLVTEDEDYDQELPTTHEEAMAQGWKYQGESLEIAPVVQGIDCWRGELVCVDGSEKGSRSLDPMQEGVELVLCTWPPEEDAERLRPIISRAETAAILEVLDREKDREPRDE